MRLYFIANWQQFYEVSDSKKVDGPLTWVAVRTKTDGLGFARIASEPDRSDLLAAWYLMVGIAAKQARAVRGKLQRDGRPLTAADMAAMTRWPAQVFDRALSFFSAPEQGWLGYEEVRMDSDKSEPTPSTGQDRTLQDLAPRKRGARKKVERNELIDTLATVDGSRIEQVTPSAWAGIGKALAEIRSVSPDVTPDEIRRRAENYLLHHKGATLSAHALAKWWAKCAQPPAMGVGVPAVPARIPDNVAAAQAGLTVEEFRARKQQQPDLALE